jgi:hypothetical protein
VEALADSLTRGAEGSLLAVTDAYGGRLWDYGRSLLDDPDAAAAAVRDALLIAGERAGSLREPGRLAAWLYALTRNECLRRGQHRAEATDAELTDLAARHGLGTADIAEICGLALDEAADRLRAVDGAGPAGFRPAPPALRAQVVDGAGPEVADYRTALARRAGPYQHDGFPRPLDQHRIGGHVVAWLTAAAVAIALVVLVLGPFDGATPRPAAQVADASVLGDAVPAGARTPPPASASKAAPPAAPATTLRPGDAAGTVAPTSVAPSSAAPPASAAGVPAGGPGTAGPDGPGGDGVPAGPPGRLVLWSQNLTAPDCAATWTARVHVTPFGAAVKVVTVSWSGGTATLSRIGTDYQGDLRDLPAGPDVPVTARATTDSGALSRTARLRYSC